MTTESLYVWKPFAARKSPYSYRMWSLFDKLISAEYFHAQDFPQFPFHAESVDMWIDSS